MPVAGKREGIAGTVRVVSSQGNVIALPDDLETESCEGRDDLLDRRVDRKLRHSDRHAGLRDEGLDDGIVLLELR